MADTLERPKRDLLDDGRQSFRSPSCMAAAMSRFEAIAAPSDGQSGHLEQVLDLMFAAACPDWIDEPAQLQQVWTEEALQRVYTMMRLVDARKQRADACPHPAAAAELVAARRLASLYRVLQACQGSDEPVPLSPVLEDSIATLVALFGAVAGDIRLRMDIAVLSLPPHQRRALVLAAGELVMNALLHGFAGRTHGWIGMILTVVNPGFGRLQLADDGGGFGSRRPNIRHGVAARLADLLAGDLAYHRTNQLTIAEIVFPLDPDHA